MSLKNDLENIVEGKNDATNFAAQLMRVVFKADSANKWRLRQQYRNLVKTVTRFQTTGDKLDLAYDGEAAPVISGATLEEIIIKIWDMAIASVRPGTTPYDANVVRQDTLKWASFELNERAELCLKAGRKGMVDFLDKYHPEWRDYIKAVMTKEEWHHFVISGEEMNKEGDQ
jgi:hypothetical protein